MLYSDGYSEREDGDMYRLTVGEYEDTVEIGTFETREEAVYALGEYALGLPPVQRVEYPRIERVED